MKDYKVTVKVRNNRILKAIEDAGGQPGKKWCDENNLTYVLVNDLINMTLSPLDADFKLRPVAEKLCDVLGKLPDELWSNEQIRPLERNFTEIEMSHEQVIAMLPNHETTYEINTDEIELPALVEEAISGLTAKERHVLKARFWEGKSLWRIGEEFDVQPERIRQIEAKALRKLRDPKNSKKLKEFFVD